MDEGLLSALELRGIGPALMSGRIADVAVDPRNRSVWYVATASSNVWKTENRGTTWTPVFDDYPSYSTGAITIDPTDSNVIWLGTGENTSQRSVGWGDGVYKSLNGGRTWTNTGLATSEHIGKILVDPRDPDVVYAAAMGGLWAPGGDRGLFKTTDGGGTWTPVLEISENTGIADVHFDPRDPDVLYAVAFQRRRHVGVLVAGGPESGVWKSTDGGESWRDITRGLPSGDLGQDRAGRLADLDPDVVYALAAAAEDRSGFYRSPDRGETWVRMSDYIVVDPQYYGEIYPDPHRMDRVYAVDVFIHVTEDGGRTFERVNTRFKHVDNHEIVFDPDDPDYMMVGTDGGLYESFDGTADVALRRESVADPVLPCRHRQQGALLHRVRGHAGQLVGRWPVAHRQRPRDSQQRLVPHPRGRWFPGAGRPGGHEHRLHPVPVRWDRALRPGQRRGAGHPAAARTRRRGAALALGLAADHQSARLAAGVLRGPEALPLRRPRRELDGGQRGSEPGARPQPAPGDGAHLAARGGVEERLHLAVRDDRRARRVATGRGAALCGDGRWSGAGERGRWWGVAAGGGLPGGASMAYVADVVASRHEPDRVYAVFNNHKEGDFRAYVARSDDRGTNWTNITGDVPDGQSSWTLVEDHLDPDLLFLGTEFGLFVTRDGGDSWVRLRGGLPTVAVRDLEIQRREDDLVLATFGRGFYILDDYSPLREMDEAVTAGAAYLFPVKDPWAYIQARPLGGQEKGTLGDAFFTAPNPPFGAVLTYHLRDGYESGKERRQRLEREALTRGEDITYPDQATLAAEDVERPPELLLVVSDEAGDVVRRVPGPRSAGLHRIAWDLRYASLEPPAPGGGEADGPMVAPGEYSARVVLVTGDGYADLTAPQSFTVKPLGTATLAAADRDALLAFQREVASLQRAAVATDRAARETSERLGLLRRAVRAAPGIAAAPYETRISALEERLFEIGRVLSRDRTALDRAEFAPPSVMQRIGRIVGAQFRATSAPTTTQRESYAVASQQLAEMSEALRTLVEGDLAALEAEVEAAGVPWTPGRPIPRWPG